MVCSISHASADAHPYERRGTVLELVASGKNRRAQGLVCLSAGWDLLEGQLATQDTWPIVVAALLAHQRVWKGVEMEIRLCNFCGVKGVYICMGVVGVVGSGCGCVKGLSAWNAVGCCLWRIASTCIKHRVVKWGGWSSDPVRRRWTVVVVLALIALAVWM